MSQQIYSPNGLKSNTHNLPIEPAYDADRLRTDPTYRYEMVDTFTAHLNSMLPAYLPDKYEDRKLYYTKRVRYYLNITLAMGRKIPEFDATLKVDVLEGGLVCEENDNGWKPQDAGDGTHIPKGKLRHLTPASSPKEWKFSPINNEEREVLCKEWFHSVQYSRFSRWGNWENKPLEQRKREFIERGRQVDPDNYHSYVKEQRKAIDGDVKQFIEKYRPLTRRGPESERVRVQRRNAKKLITNELAGSPSIDWMAFTVWYELEWVAILWGMLEYKRFLKLEAGAIKILSSQNESTLQPSALPVDSEAFNGVAGPESIHQRVLALFVWYCQESKEIPEFDQMQDGYKAVTEPYSLAWKPFQMQYSRISKSRLTHDFLPALQKAVERLRQSGKYPNALAIAEQDLLKAELS